MATILSDDMGRRGDELQIPVGAILRQLQDMPAMRDSLDRHELFMLTLLRSRGLTWVQIGDALGMTRQGATDRFRQLAARLPSDDLTAADGTDGV